MNKTLNLHYFEYAKENTEEILVVDNIFFEKIPLNYSFFVHVFEVTL